NFVEEVDAVDNGISQYDGEARYAVSSTLSARVAHLNPRWNSKSQDTEKALLRYVLPSLANMLTMPIGGSTRSSTPCCQLLVHCHLPLEGLYIRSSQGTVSSNRTICFDVYGTRVIFW
ncbi:hypothetical protein GOODEAATRI_009588, partial [Goodea atripinnis]